jgi:putative MATE family efflux protein
MMLIMVVMIAVSGGSSVLVAHAYGADDHRKVSRIASRAMSLMILASLLFVTPAGLIFSGHIFRLLGAEERVMRLGILYLDILFMGSVFNMFTFGVTGILLGVGKTRVSLIFLIFINLLNIVLNYIFIFGLGPVPGFGVGGAALGTVVARGIGSLAGLWILKSPRFGIEAGYRAGCAIDIPLLKKILFLGGPRSLQGIVRNSSRLAVIWIIGLLPRSTRLVSAYTVSMQVRMISTFIGLAFMSATMSRVGQNLGAGDVDSAEQSGWIASGMAAGLMSILALAFIIFPEHIMAFFTDDAEVISEGIVFFLIIALAEPAMAFAFALGGGLRGGGDPLSPFIYSSVSDLCVVIAVGYILAIKMGMGLSGVAVAVFLSAFTRAVPITWKFSRGTWKKYGFKDLR